MKPALLFLGFIIYTNYLTGQVSHEYSAFIKKADSLYNAKEYKKSAIAYSEAFKANGWKGSTYDRYYAARSWALAGFPDSAFFQLYRTASKANYANYNQICTDPALTSLHNDKRWAPLLEIVKHNKDKSEAGLNKPLVYQLDSIDEDDQKYRNRMKETEKKFGPDSKEMNALWKIINKKDSINILKIRAILDKYGWLGPDVIGWRRNNTLFLVIQHSDLATQEKYLPMLREAVKNGKASGSNLALLEDRIAVRQGKKQIYGSQIGRDMVTKLYYVEPLEDPDNVDKRRSTVGLNPLAEYLSQWQIKWDVEQYKSDLLKIESKEKARKK